MAAIKEPIRLRTKELKNGNKSLYLDCYFNGRRSYEFLKLYLIPEVTRWDKERNKTTLMQAEGHKAKRIIELQQSKYGIVQNGYTNRIKLSEYIRQVGKYKRLRHNNNTVIQYHYAASTIEQYGDIDLQKADKRYFEGYIRFLKTCTTPHGEIIKENTQLCRLRKVNASLNKAVADGLINNNPLTLVSSEEKPKQRNGEKVYLTLQELEMLKATICKYGTVKRAFLFSCFCGLRISDIRRLRWQDIKNTTEGTKQVEIKQQKTNERVFIPLSTNALQWLPPYEEGTKTNELIFKRLPHSNSEVNRYLTRWAKDAGINKHISYHVSRHTCATLLLSYGADIYTVSKILGHSKISTTEIYAKVIDKKRVEAVNLIPTI